MPLTRRNYDSGPDFKLDYGELTYSFNERDFLERAEFAARQLGLVQRELADQELEDLAELVVEGLPPKHPRSPLGEHLQKHWAIVLLGEPKPVHWVRRLMFRHAWLDQRVIDGELDVKFVNGSIEYTDPRRRGEVIELAEHPDLSGIGYR